MRKQVNKYLSIAYKNRLVPQVDSLFIYPLGLGVLDSPDDHVNKVV